MEQDELACPVSEALAGTFLAEARQGDLAGELEQARGLRRGWGGWGEGQGGLPRWRRAFQRENAPLNRMDSKEKTG